MNNDTTSYNNISSSVKQLLNDDNFLLWCFAPTEESDAYWIAWVESHPDCAADLDRAIEIAKGIRINEYRLPEEDHKRIYSEIIHKHNIQKKHKNRKLYYGFAAACVAAVCAIGSLLWLNPMDTVDDLRSQLLDVAIDSTQTEIELHFDNREKLLVDNSAVIEYDSKGDVQVNGNKKSKIKEDKVATVDMNVLKVPYGRRSSLVLADGTKVWVNSGTVLRFPSVFDGEKREVYVDGEVYLDVAKDASRPFYVKTKDMDVRVLGTSFNISAYKEDKVHSVVLVEGRVSVSDLSGQKMEMKPNEMLSLNEGVMNISIVDVDRYICWKDGMFKFEGETLESVVQRLTRYYRLNIDCAPDVRTYACSGKLILFDDFSKVMETLQDILPITYEKNGNTIKISNNKNKK